MIDLQYYTKDNLPVTLIENIIAHNFLLIDIILIIACLILIAKLSKQQWNWKVFAIVCIPSILSGFIIGAINYYIDNQIPGWIVLPWNTLGIIGYWYIEDWLFYCFTTIFFYGLYRYYHKSLRNDFRYKITVIKDGNNLIITDNGCGFDTSKIKKGFSTKQYGHGLGLIYSIDACKTNNIDVKINSRIGIGTTISLDLSKVIEN